MILCMDNSTAAGQVAFQIVCSTKSMDYEHGNARLAWKRLSNKYTLKIAPTLLQLQEEFYNAKLKQTEAPNEYMTWMEDIKQRLSQNGININYKQFFIKTINSLPNEYSLEQNFLEHQFNNLNKPVNIEMIWSELCFWYKCINKGKTKDTFGVDEQQALYTSLFKGHCHCCSKQGYKAADCHMKKVADLHSVEDGSSNHS